MKFRRKTENVEINIPLSFTLCLFQVFAKKRNRENKEQRVNVWCVFNVVIMLTYVIEWEHKTQKNHILNIFLMKLMKKRISLFSQGDHRKCATLIIYGYEFISLFALLPQWNECLFNNSSHSSFQQFLSSLIRLLHT